MGLDMYLRGRKHVWPNYDHPERDPVIDGFKVNAYILDLGYWRKQPNLHGYIVQHFAGGVDECQRIDLTVENLRELVHAIASDLLPHTEGFFFGTHDNSDEQKRKDIDTLMKAHDWLVEGEAVKELREVYYQASW